MKRNVIICTAWPYAYSEPHLGNFLQIMSGGVLKRYYNHTGANVIHVSGSDCHGARIEYQARKEGITPKELVKRVHAKIKQLIKDYNIDFTNYTWTESPTHKKFVREFYTKVYNNNYIITKIEQKPYCNNCKLFLADRFITGECPYCGAKDAKGNQCDACGRLLEPEELKNPKCEICGKNDIEIKNTKQWYLALNKLQKAIKEYADSHPEWNEITKEYTYRWLKEGLKARPITRDLKWGIPAPFPDSKGKSIYVWAEAVLGYVSASIEWAKKNKTPGAWKEFWFKNCKQVYCQGKDNIPFHTIILPGLLISSGEKYQLPSQISSTYFLNWEGGLKFSKTNNVGLWCDEALKIHPNEDYWRYYIMSHRPENRDREFSWLELEKEINATLVGNIGNLYNRCLKFIEKHYKGTIKGLLENPVKNRIVKAFKDSEKIFEAGGISEAIKVITKLSAYGNEYFQSREPWADKEGRENTLYNCYQVLKAITIMLEPITPRSMKKAWKMLGLKGDITKTAWEFNEEKTIKIGKPSILFEKVEEGTLKKQFNELKGGDYIEYDDFAKIKLVTGKVIEAKPHGKKLLKLRVKADKERTIMAGLKDYYKPEELIGKNVIIIANLKPKKLAGEVSEGMLLAAEKGQKVTLLTTDKEMPSGSKIC